MGDPGRDGWGGVQGLHRTQLAPLLQPGDVVILDNLSVQRTPELGRSCVSGARLLFLPQYSPNLNLIEMALSKKAHLRADSARTFEPLSPRSAKSVPCSFQE